MQEKSGYLASLDAEVGNSLIELRPLHAKLAEQFAIRSRDLLGTDHSVHQVVECVRGEHQLDVIHRAVIVHVSQPLVEQLVTQAHLRVQSREASLGETNLAVEVIDRDLRLCDQIFLRRYLRIEAADQRVNGIDLGLRVQALVQNALQLLLILTWAPMPWLYAKQAW